MSTEKCTQIQKKCPQHPMDCAMNAQFKHTNRICSKINRFATIQLPFSLRLCGMYLLLSLVLVYANNKFNDSHLMVSLACFSSSFLVMCIIHDLWFCHNVYIVQCTYGFDVIIPESVGILFVVDAMNRFTYECAFQCFSVNMHTVRTKKKNGQ